MTTDSLRQFLLLGRRLGWIEGFPALFEGTVRGVEMDIIRGIAVIVLGGAGLYLSGLNWLILWKGVVRKEHHSVVPFLGGGLLAAAILCTPMWPLWWTALIVDWGSVPWVSISLGILLLRKIRKTSDQ